MYQFDNAFDPCSFSLKAATLAGPDSKSCLLDCLRRLNRKCMNMRFCDFSLYLNGYISYTIVTLLFMKSGTFYNHKLNSYM